MTKIHFKMDDDLLNPCFDSVFKALFTKDIDMSRKALMGFLSATIGRDVSDVAIKQNEPASESARDRQIRFDVSCTFNDGELANITHLTSFPREMSGRCHTEILQICDLVEFFR